jgi:hypothetical protein
MDNNNNTNNNNDNDTIYLDVTDEEFLYIINNLNLPSYIINNKYVNDRLKTLNKIS